jgi:DNA polymerase-3 subunit epsilon
VSIPAAPGPGPESAGRPTTYHQQTIDALLDDPRTASLSTTTFVVVDLETTGSAPADCGITEIGAVKVRGGEVVGEFSTLVNPGTRIPPYITVLTGITEAMIAPAPKLAAVLPSFLEFAAGAVLVAHNAPFDVGFLKAACAQHGHPWPGPPVVDTVALARRAVTSDEVPNRKLCTLAQFFRTPHQPSHRALDDARATVDVLHALIGRLGSYHVDTLGDLLDYLSSVSPIRRTRRHLAEGLPEAPGVYLFRDKADRPLYIGTSSSIATRVRSYFTASERRPRIDEMLVTAHRVEAIVCAHPLEAAVRELRLISVHKPPYNRASKYPERAVWLKLTAEVYPRLSVVRRVLADNAPYLGPFSSSRAAELAMAAVHDAVRLRRCSQRLSHRKKSPACALLGLNRCDAPCEHQISPAEYSDRVAGPVRMAIESDPGGIVEPLLSRVEVLASQHRYEEATVVRERLAAFLRSVIRGQRLAAFTTLAELVAARPASDGGWEIAVIRHGRLAGAAFAPPGVPPAPIAEVAVLAAETVIHGPGPVPCATATETERILTWLEQPETRLVSISGSWCSPVAGAGRWNELLERAEYASRTNRDETTTFR